MAGISDDHPPWPGHGNASSGGALFTGMGAICETVVRLSAVDGAAIAVFAPSHTRELVYASDALAQQIDDLQFVVGEGPCLDAYHLGTPQSCPRLDTDLQVGRWPAFCDGALELGVRAVFAFPVPGPDGALGVLELYRQCTGELDEKQFQSASVGATAIADTLSKNWATNLLGAIDAVGAIETISVDPGGQLGSGGQFSRARVYIASGMVAVQLGVSADDGLDRLRAYTYARGRPIDEVAADILTRRLSLRDDGKDC